MDYDELIEKLGKEPGIWLFDGYGTPREEGYYLYQIHLMHGDYWENGVYFFNTINEFVDFLPGIVFSNLAVDSMGDDFWEENHDFSEDWNRFQELKSGDWDEERCVKFIKEYGANNYIEFIEFGKISDLLSVTQEEYDKCYDSIDSTDELEEEGLTEGRYKIFTKFHEESDDRPGLDKEGFLEMLSNWGG